MYNSTYMNIEVVPFLAKVRAFSCIHENKILAHGHNNVKQL
jgi:hypothetical protein